MYTNINEFNGFLDNFLTYIAILSVISGILIVVSKNPIISVLYLILLFSNISCYLIFVGIKFIGISYLLVYVGAVSILFLFILMLLNIRVSELISDTSNSIPLAFLSIITIYLPFSKLVPDTQYFNEGFYINNVSSSNWDSTLVDVSDIMSLGNVMYSNFSIWLIITSLILLLAMVGSIVITIKQ